MRERVQTLDQIQNYVGEYYSKEWIMKNVLMMSEEDVQTMQDQIAAEKEAGGGDDDEL